MERRWRARALTSWAAAVATLAATFTVTSVVVAPGRADAAASVAMQSVYDKTVYGDLLEFGNSELTCPTGNAGCVTGGGTYTAANNDYSMVYADVDSDSSTYNSSQATFTIPAGTTVAYARLSWSAMSTASDCDAVFRSGTAATDPVKLNVGSASPSGAAYTSVPSTYFNNDGAYYTAAADVTANFASVVGGTKTTVTVANVFGPTGTKCSIGWGMEVVYQATAPTCATQQRHVFIYNGHQTVSSTTVTVPVTGFRVSDVPATVGVIAYEGDASTTGDKLAINGTNIAEPVTGNTNNFFVSAANGASNPTFPTTRSVASNYSVDAKTFSAPASVIKVGDTSATLSLSTTGDIYVLQAVALSVAVPGLCITKSVSPTVVHPGDPVTWTVTVSNTGSGGISSINVTDPLVPACARSISTVAGGGSTSYTCTSTASGQSVTNTVSASAVNSTGDAVSGTASAPLTVLNPALKVTKVVNYPTVVAGTQVTYTISVQNTGDAALANVAVDDTITNGCDRSIGSLAKGAVSTYTCQAVITRDTVNTVTVTGDGPAGSTVNATASASVRVIHPALGLVKAAGALQDATGNGPTAGDTIPYTFTVTNTGDTPISQVAVIDPLVPTVSCPLTALPVGGSTTCTGGHVVTQAEIDAGVVRNTATVSGSDPNGDSLTSGPSSTTTPLSPVSSLQLTKRAAPPTDVDHSGSITTGDTIAYTFSVTNTGATTLSGLAVHDPMRPVVTCSPTTLAPGETASCTTAPYAITQADLDAGAVNNVATATAATPQGATTTSNSSSTSTPLPTAPALALVKTAGTPNDVNRDGLVDAGDTIPYAFRITNSGNTTIDEVTTPWGRASAIVRIPRFGAAYAIPVLEGAGSSQLSAGFGHLQGTAGPGAVGNMVLAAHRITHGEPLRRMPELRVGDHVIVVTRTTTYDYRLLTSGAGLVVRFTAGWVTQPRPRDPDGNLARVLTGNRLLTLATCAELFHTDNRMVAFATLVGVRPTPPG